MVTIETIGRRVRILMADRRITQDQLAQKAGISKGSVNKVYQGSGDGLTFKTLTAIAFALEITLAELVMPPGYDIIESPEREHAGVVQWLTATEAPLGQRFPLAEISQPDNIEVALDNLRKNRRQKSL